ncbi:MAG: hypothetical protein HY650_00955 [Acidobacteria bacterium]|nr:hypothetical protein [Acidobacteriota bacterium]
MKPTAIEIILSCIFTLLLVGAVPAQEQPAQESGEPRKEEPKQEAQSPDPDEGTRWGTMITRTTLDFGWREVWRHGNSNVYGSQVNLSSGMRLLGFSTEMRAEKGTGTLLDYLSYDMSNWGGDPYNSARLRVEKHRVYRLVADYRRSQYFNFLPTFANPLLERGVFFGQHSYDSSRRMSGTTLTILPDAPFQFHFGYERNSAFGRSFTTYSVGLDEFVLSNDLRTTTDDYRLGFDWALPRASITFEQGIRKHRDDPTTFEPAGVIANYGNSSNVANPTSMNPKPILLDAFTRSTAQRITIPTTRFAVQARPVRRLSFTGRVAYSDASLDFTRFELLNGTLFDRSVLRYFTESRARSVASASQPSVVTDASVNIQVHDRFSLIDIFRFNRFTIAGNAVGRTTEILGEDLRGQLPPPGQETRDFSSMLVERTALSSVSNQIEGIFDATSRIVLRAGYRYGHRTAHRFPGAENLEEQSELNTHTFLSGASIRMSRQLRAFLQVERGQADNVFTRISPRDFVRVRLRGRYRPGDKFLFTGSFGLYDATNPNPVVNNDLTNRTFTLATSYFPAPRFSLNLAYTWTGITSQVDVINPRTQEVTPQRYRANDSFVDVLLQIVPLRSLSFDVGYVIINANGTFPLNYHQPTGRIAYTHARRYTFYVDWRWWGYNERGIALQDYRAHALTSGFKLTL